MKQYKITDLFKTSWEELNAQEIIDVITLSEKLHQDAARESTTYGLLVIAMLKVLRRSNKLVSKIDVEQAVDCFNNITFFHRDKQGEFLTPWTHFPLGGFNFHLNTFRPPERNGMLPMYNRTFDQLVYADSAFGQFCVMHYEHQQTQSKALARDIEDTISGLIGILYTLPDDFDPVNLEVKARIVSLHFNTQQRALILHTYANIRKYIISRCPNLFPQPDEVDDNTPPPAPRETGPMWMNLRYDLAETEAFKGLQVARRAWMYDALDYLDKKALENTQKPKQHA
jgi:hypothetical protein